MAALTVAHLVEKMVLHWVALKVALLAAPLVDCLVVQLVVATVDPRAVLWAAHLAEK
jgi:hypothetical protein